MAHNLLECEYIPTIPLILNRTGMAETTDIHLLYVGMLTSIDQQMPDCVSVHRFAARGGKDMIFVKPLPLSYITP